MKSNTDIKTPFYMRRNGFDPVAELARVRDTSGGVQEVVGTEGETAFLVTRHEDVKAVLADYKNFSNDFPQGFGHADVSTMTAEDIARDRAGNLLGQDPPDHQRLRRMLTPEFTLRRIKRLEPRIAEIVEARLDAMAAAGPPVDLVSEFALPIPSLVICELLGVPVTDRDEFEQRTARELDMTTPPDELKALQQESYQYMLRLVRGARLTPGEDILGMLVREHGDDLVDDELVGIAGLLLLAGHDTTANMLGLGTLALLQNPDQLALVRENPDAIGPAIEEMLRYLSILHHAVTRLTTTDVVVGGVVIPAGSLVFASLAAGNRDRSFIDRPEELDVRRGAPGHLAFGHGVHHCLGAPLARMEMRVAFPALLRRFPTLMVAEPFEDVQFRSFNFIFGLRSLSVGW